MNLSVSLLMAAALAQPPADVSTAESYKYLRAIRDEAQSLSEPPQAQPADLQRALKKYQTALDYLASAPVAERASGDTGLQSEYVNLMIPMAGTYARLGMKEQALSALEKVTPKLWLPALSHFADAPAFASLRDEPRFKALLKTAAIPDRLYRAPAIATKYKPVLSTEEKVAGLSLFWAEARRNFVHFDHVPDLDWNQVYMDYLTKVMAAPTTRDYYRVMMQLAPLLQDGHTNIYAPQELANEMYSRPALRTVLLEDKVLVSHVGNPTLASRVKVGEEIVAIDNVPVRQYAEQEVAPFVSASTSQDKALRTYTYQLLGGAADKPAALRLRSVDGTERTEIVERGEAYQAPRQFEFRMLPGEIAYLSLDQFENDEALKQMELVFPEILKAKGLVLDVRRNGGGNGGIGLEVLSYLSRESIESAASFVRADDVVLRAQAGPHVLWAAAPWSGRKFSNPRKEIYSGPVAVLTSAQTFSAAEDFSVAFRGMKRGLIIGEATGGSTGQPLIFGLPGGGKARICVKRDTYPDGSPFVGIGVLPDIVVGPTIASLRSGTDPVLERALLELAKR